MSNGSEPGTNVSADWMKPPVEQEGLSRYVATLRERYWVILTAIAITTAIAIAYVSTASKVYEGSADVLVTPAVAQDGLVVALPVIRESSDPTRDVETASRLVTNIDVANRVKKQLKSPLTGEQLLDRVTAEPIAQSNIVVVRAEESSPASAAALANAFATETITEQTQQLHDFIDQTLPALRARLKSNGGGPGAGSIKATVAELEAKRSAPDPTLQILTKATQPSHPVKPKPLISIIGGVLAGLVLGDAAAFALQVLDPRLRREDQLRRLYRLPILARIPKENNASDKPIEPLKLSPAAAEAYRTLRGTLAVSRRSAGDGSRAILVTGSSASVGKTTTAVNLATSLAAAGQSVILIESDLRRPSIARALGIKPQHGVVSALIDSVAVEDALTTTEQFGPNLGMLLADYEGGWISELFALPAARKLVADCKELADYVVIDSPPLTDVVDALPLAGYVDDVLLVVRIGKTTLSKLSQLGELLAENGTKPAGFAVVGTQRPGRSDYHYYGIRGAETQLARSKVS